jgi:hypothetical protein
MTLKLGELRKDAYVDDDKVREDSLPLGSKLKTCTQRMRELSAALDVLTRLEKE